MPLRMRLLAAAALVPLAGCAEIDYRLWQLTDGKPPGLVPVAAPAPEPPPQQQPEPEIRPQARNPLAKASVPLAQSMAALRDDPMALRFLAVRQLVKDGLLTADAVERRINTNFGGLLPLTAPEKPAEGLDRPIPPLEVVFDQFRRLDEDAPGPMRSAERAARRDFLLDQLLPENPAKRMILAPHDKESARAVLARLGHLEDAGLITPEERTQEAAAVEAMMTALPEKLLPPPPPPPEPAKKKKKSSGKGTGSANPTKRLQGGVSGKLEVIPSPLSFEPPKLTADFKGSAGAHLLSMASVTHGEVAWQSLTTQFKAELQGLSYKVSRTDLGDLGITYRLIAGPMEPAAAEKLCGALRQKGQACMPTPFPE
jgi:hypothetical protein